MLGGSVLRLLLKRYNFCRFLRREMLSGSFFNSLPMIVSFLIFSWVWSSVNNPLRKSCLLGIPCINKVKENSDWSS